MDLDLLCTISDMAEGGGSVIEAELLDVMVGHGRRPETMDAALDRLERQRLVEPDRRDVLATCARRQLRLTRKGCDVLALGAAGWYFEAGAESAS